MCRVVVDGLTSPVVATRSRFMTGCIDAAEAPNTRSSCPPDASALISRRHCRSMHEQLHSSNARGHSAPAECRFEGFEHAV